MKKRLAIIGASTGQLPLCLKAKEMGLETYCFAWPKGAVCKEHVDHFIPVSIMEREAIINYCQEHQIDGVVSNASDFTALTVSYVAERLGKVCTPYEALRRIQDKSFVRERTNALPDLLPVPFTKGTFGEILTSFPRPYVMKPVIGASKKGVNFVDDVTVNGLVVAEDLKDSIFMAEAYVSGKEYSVESMSYLGKHQVIQITEKIGTGAPHFVELEHHQPASLSTKTEMKVRTLIPRILSSVGFTNGASHIEIKINAEGQIFLIEVNPRGGGGCISNELVHLSTDYDYLKQLILVSLGEYVPLAVNHRAYSGIYFLTAYTKRLLPYFEKTKESWMVMRERHGSELTASCSNYDRDGFIVYCANKKMII